MCTNLSTWLLLLLLEESKQTYSRDLGDLETHPGNVTLSVARTTEPSDEDLVVLLEEVEATITGHEGSDLLAILDQLHADGLADSRVGLLSLNAYFLKHDALGMRGTTKWVALDGSAEVPLLVVLVGPLLDATVVAQLARRCDATGLTRTHLSARGMNAASPC